MKTNVKTQNETSFEKWVNNQDLPQAPNNEYYCQTCDKIISKYQYYKGKGLCKECIIAIN